VSYNLKFLFGFVCESTTDEYVLCGEVFRALQDGRGAITTNEMYKNN